MSYIRNVNHDIKLFNYSIKRSGLFADRKAEIYSRSGSSQNNIVFVRTNVTKESKLPISKRSH